MLSMASCTKVENNYYSNYEEVDTIKYIENDTISFKEANDELGELDSIIKNSNFQYK